MKKILFILVCCLAPMTFYSCDDEDTALAGEIAGEVLGGMNLTFQGTTYNLPAATFYTTSTNTYIGATSGSNTVAIMLDGKTAKTYKLGFASSFEGLFTGGLSSMSNYLTFVNTSDATDPYVVVMGTCTISSITSEQVTGSFSGKTLKLSQISNLSYSSIVNLLTSANQIECTSFSAKLKVK
ncbi:MAG: hypothetical protein LKE30_06770 [Bacteroidales bacterium]|jgi:hypothetical protein|nr:hypothetical protein [Bacteroidales bacterium]